MVNLQEEWEKIKRDGKIKTNVSEEELKSLGYSQELIQQVNEIQLESKYEETEEWKKYVAEQKQLMSEDFKRAGFVDEKGIGLQGIKDKVYLTKEVNINEKANVKDEFLNYIGDKKINKASEVLVNYILKNYNIITSKNDEKNEMWIYKEGVYVPEGKSEVKCILRDILLNWYSAFYYNLVMNKLEADTMIDIDKFFKDVNINEVPVKNGILNILTKELKPFDPNNIFFNKLPVEYNPDAKCPQIEKFLGEVLAKEDDRDVFYELGGFCLLKEYKFEKAFMFLGDGRNGKDKTLELIKRTIGVENCCSIPLSSLDSKGFIISEFFGKMANIAGDIDNRDLKETTTFKGLTGRSLQTGDRKFKSKITFVNYAKFIFACNNLPLVYDTSKGFWDRWVLLEFPYTFVTSEELSQNKLFKLRDDSIIEKITTPDELSGLLNKFLDGLERLFKNKNFSSTKGSEEIKSLWIRKSNSAMAFGMDMIEDSYDSYITKKDFRKRYTDYCKKHKIPVKSDYIIKRTLEELFGIIDGEKNILNVYEHVWDGIKWKK